MFSSFCSWLFFLPPPLQYFCTVLPFSRKLCAYPLPSTAHFPQSLPFSWCTFTLLRKPVQILARALTDPFTFGALQVSPLFPLSGYLASMERSPWKTRFLLIELFRLEKTSSATINQSPWCCAFKIVPLSQRWWHLPVSECCLTQSLSS